jgi:hypothetical protein
VSFSLPPQDNSYYIPGFQKMQPLFLIFFKKFLLFFQIAVFS